MTVRPGAPGGGPRGRPGRALALWFGTAALLLGLLPLILPAVAAGLAWLGGCALQLADRIPPCHVGGVEVTSVLRITAMAPWLFVATWPLAALGAGVLALAGVIALVRAVRRRP